jgi:pyridoxamine 5'-phosphate oxidase family protein
VSAGGQPDVVPVSFEFDGNFFWVGGSGASVLATRKFRNVAAGNHEVALVVDDMVSFDPIIARDIRVYGDAQQPVERVGLVGPGTYIRITPRLSWSWNLEGKPVDDAWYRSRRTVHAVPEAPKPGGEGPRGGAWRTTYSPPPWCLLEDVDSQGEMLHMISSPPAG